jgi:hypothetical protein
MNRIAHYGLLAGVLMSLVLFGPFFIVGPDPDWAQRWGRVIGYAGMVLALAATFFAMRAERERVGGVIGFGRALGIGLGVSAVAAVFFGLATWGFYGYVGDALPQQLFESYLAAARAGDGDPATVAARVAEVEAMRGFFFNYPLQGAVMGATVFLIGAVESLVGAAIVRRRG